MNPEYLLFAEVEVFKSSNNQSGEGDATKADEKVKAEDR